MQMLIGGLLLCSMNVIGGRRVVSLRLFRERGYNYGFVFPSSDPLDRRRTPFAGPRILWTAS